MPEGLRLFIRDALEAAIVALGTVSVVFPTSVKGAQEVGVVIAIAVGAAVWAVARRELLPILLNILWPKPTP
jgi:hypothetical protein